MVLSRFYGISLRAWDLPKGLRASRAGPKRMSHPGDSNFQFERVVVDIFETAAGLNVRIVIVVDLEPGNQD